MTLTEYLDAIAEKLGVSGLPDRLLTTYLEAFAKKDGVDVSALPDRLASTYLNAILKAKGVQPVKDNLLTTQLAALAGAYGATDLPYSLVSTYLDAIVGKKIQFVVTGNEAFNFSSGNNAVYFTKDEFVNISKEGIISAECTHFTFGSGNVLADMKDGEFIFNVSTTTGTATGNVSFKKAKEFTSKDSAVAWFKEQAANGTPVIVTCYIKG